ncbi:MAG: hypothetical protein QKV08_gp1 [Sanya nyamivirus 1]|uniref:Nucleoprotein n=2 Tax=Nyamiviridae TaxID=1513294 RepID=A0A8K1XF67_9MONO|nr:MAG: hypothetical protein QKV08_gp1 [Sanya nyamivirus 1]UHM27503.1 MAG: hypothetical protein SaNyV1_gp1 [Sanya nyamivirus 1]UHR49720.1 MAG: P40 protein [Hangzhou Nyamivirus 1]
MGKFADREEIVPAGKPTLRTDIAAVASEVYATGQADIGTVEEEFIISCTYWMIGHEDSEVVIYDLDKDPKFKTTAEGQQFASFVGLCHMIGFVKEPTADNAPSAIRRWSAGMAGVGRDSLLDETKMKWLWLRLAAIKANVYKYAQVKDELLHIYLQTRQASRGSEPPATRAVLTQLDMVYEHAHLKSVNMMVDMIGTGSRLCEIPVIFEELKKLVTAVDKVKKIEGAGYAYCRLQDSSKYPDLNHSAYPNLYNATLIWAKKHKVVQKNYKGSKAIMERSTQTAIIQRVVKEAGIESTVGELSADDKAWLADRGYTAPADSLRQTLTDKGKKKKKKSHESETEEESGAESDDSTTSAPKKRKIR